MFAECCVFNKQLQPAGIFDRFNLQGQAFTIYAGAQTRKDGKTITTFKHDNAKTVWSLRPFIIQPEYFDENDVNKNNITSKEVISTYSHNGQTDTYKSTYRYEYEYTPEGYPKTIKEYNSEGKLKEIKEYEY